ncbi:MAG: response regulator transcription factor [Solirubrobacterales bacterium]|nr:response regulator transcription factor [Solirubrobacterales bacterium]MBV9797296.1 response regulator transcription factor [Solirubrobacterales bacterium]
MIHARPLTDAVSSSDPKVIVVDDHELFRRGIIELLKERGIQVAGEAALAADAIRQATELGPGVVLMDLSMPGMSGIEATQRLSAAAPLARILVLTMMTDDEHVMNALLAGACGYLLKDAPISQIIEGIRAAARGESMISPRIASRLVRRMREPEAIEPGLAGADMTPRELEVLELLARGLDNAEIGRALYLSQHTVKNHVSNILIKLQVENRIQAAVRAVRGGLV